MTLLIGQEDKNHYVLIKILIHSCIIILYTTKKKFFLPLLFASLPKKNVVKKKIDFRNTDTINRTKRQEPLCSYQNFNAFMYNHTLHHGKKKHFCHYCLHVFSPEEILKRHIKKCFKINAKQKIILPKKSKYVKFKNYEKKNKVTI